MSFLRNQARITVWQTVKMAGDSGQRDGHLTVKIIVFLHSNRIESLSDGIIGRSSAQNLLVISDPAVQDVDIRMNIA